MPRLRTTTVLSALALLIGIAGTGWLSGLTHQWQELADRVAMVRRTPTVPTNRPIEKIRHAPLKLVQPHRVRRVRDIDDSGTAQVAAFATPATLQPLATPEDTSQSWDQLRGHLDGQVVVQVRVDAAGQVDGASVIASSGDPILDQHALRSVRGWRFAVPPGHPDGLSGELPMRFSSQARQLGML